MPADRGGAPGVEAVEAYLADVPAAQRAVLVEIRTTLRSLLPDATECMKYGMPAFALGGKGVAGYAAWRNHCGYYPMSGSVIAAAGDAIAGYEQSKGGIRFGVEERLPVSLIRHLVDLRLAELDARKR